MFVQTTAKPRPRDPVSIELSVPGRREPIRLEGQVARVFVVPGHLVAVAQGGIGLRITNAPEDFFALVGNLQTERRLGTPGDPGSGGAAEASAEPRRAYRVRITQLGHARTRTLRLLARSAEEAASLARAETGEGWKVLESSEDEGPASRD
jgi:hypothetical protein